MARAIEARRRAGRTSSATSSVRLWVRPPARKNRRLTRPVTTTASPRAEGRRLARRPEPGDRHRAGGRRLVADGDLVGHDGVARRQVAERGSDDRTPHDDGDVADGESPWELLEPAWSTGDGRDGDRAAWRSMVHPGHAGGGQRQPTHGGATGLPLSAARAGSEASRATRLPALRRSGGLGPPDTRRKLRRPPQASTSGGPGGVDGEPDLLAVAELEVVAVGVDDEGPVADGLAVVDGARRPDALQRRPGPPADRPRPGVSTPTPRWLKPLSGGDCVSASMSTMTNGRVQVADPRHRVAGRLVGPAVDHAHPGVGGVEVDRPVDVDAP